MRVPFNKPVHFPRAEEFVVQSLRSGGVAGNRAFGKRCMELLQEDAGALAPFLAPSCTAALEMGALLADLQPGDEVILPSYTFSSTANSVLLRGAKPVFCELDPSTLNLDPGRVPELITDRTRMILPIDYAGIPCDMDPLLALAAEHGLIVMQDAAQSYGSTYKGKIVGSYAPLVAFSFHETKNLSCGEGGALCVNDEELVERAHLLQEKGTDRRRVLLGLQNKYSWVDLGSSFLLADTLAAVLQVQLEESKGIVRRRGAVTAAYEALYRPYHDRSELRIADVPEHVTVNNHAFWVVFNTENERAHFLTEMREHSVSPYIGYLPLHSSAMGRRHGYKPEDLPLTEAVGKTVVRLPLYTTLPDDIDYTIEAMSTVLRGMFGG